MNEVFKILRLIESTSSRNDKKSILETYRDNALLRKYFLYAYDSRKVFGIGKKSIKPFNTKTAPAQQGLRQNSLFGVTKVTHRNIFDLLDDLIEHPFGSKEDQDAVNNFLSQQDEEAYDWYTRLLLKDLKIGCTATTINEVWDGYIPVFQVMLAFPYEKHVDKINGEFQLQRKLDGFRLITILNPDGKINFYTRSGLELFNFPEIEKDFKELEVFDTPVVFDGECIANNEFNDTQKLIMVKGPKTGLVYNVFDLLSLDEWDSGSSEETLFSRYDFLRNDIFYGKDLKHIQLVPELYRGNDKSAITKWFNYSKVQGWEGIMIKLDSYYLRTRTANMLKVKEFETLDLVVLRVNEGTGKHQGRLGSVTVDFDGNEVDVGSGFDDFDRERLWRMPEMIVGKTIEVQFFEKTRNERGEPSLRFPVYKCTRYDK